MARIDLADTSETGDGDPQAARPPITDPALNAPGVPDTPPVKGSPELDVPAPVEMVEATSEEAAEGIDWVKTGWVRLRMREDDGTIQTYRLRAPKWKHLEHHRLDLEEIEDEVEARRQAVLRHAAEMAVEMTKARDLPEPERSDRLAQLVREDRKAGREFTSFAEHARIDWLTSVWNGPLGAPFGGAPDDWPAYVVNPEFCTKLIAHWRTVPLDHGG